MVSKKISVLEPQTPRRVCISCFSFGVSGLIFFSQRTVLFWIACSALLIDHKKKTAAEQRTCSVWEILPPWKGEETPEARREVKRLPISTITGRSTKEIFKQVTLRDLVVVEISRRVWQRSAATAALFFVAGRIGHIL